MNFVKWGAIIAVVFLVFRGLSRSYDLGSPNLNSDGDAVSGSGWAAPLTQRRDVRAWAPPFGIPRQ